MVRRVFKLALAVIVIGFLSFLTVEVGSTEIDTASQVTPTAVTATLAVPMACASEEEMPPCPDCRTCTGGCTGCFGIQCGSDTGLYCGMLRSQTTGEYTSCWKPEVA
jgi:hypothetical protein